MTSDEQRIANLLADYCWHVDRRDVEAVLGLFTPDAAFDLGFGRIHRGRVELRRMYERLDAYTATSHHVAGPRIDLTGDTARVRAALYAFHRRPDNSELHLWGVYLDRLVRVGDSWLIDHRALRASAESGGIPEGGRATRFEPLPRS
jgi:ketosteroid isomerase-like protein